jgi:hypothetical protein
MSTAAKSQKPAKGACCSKCGSTKLAPFFNERVLDVAGKDAVTGQHYTSIIVRRTRCLEPDCNQVQDVRQLVNDKPGKAA